MLTTSQQETIKNEAYQNVVIIEAKKDMSNLRSDTSKSSLKLPKGGLSNSGKILKSSP